MDPMGAGDPAWQLRKYLLLLAILVATVTYVAGMDPPGGVWLETKDGHRTGNPILPDTRRWRYRLFYYFNATSFAASLVVTILLLFLKHDDARDEARLTAVRAVMVLDVLCLMVAYVAGSSRGLLTTVYASLLCAVVFSFFAVFTWMAMREQRQQPVSKDDGSRKVGRSDMLHGRCSDKLRVKERRKVLMLLAVFVTTITYTAGLNPPGGFWEHAAEGEGHSISSHRAGDPILLERHPKRFLAFLICNTTAFAASLVVITLLLSRRLWNPDYGKLRIAGLYASIVVALLGLMGAYAAGSGRETGTTVYILFLVFLVLLYIFIFAVVEMRTQEEGSSGGDNQAQGKNVVVPVLDDSEADGAVEKARSLILLLATLAATVTYQAGLNPPGGVWRDDGDGHAGGSLILLATHARRYKVFFYCNSAAFVTSIVVVIMVQSPHRLVSPRALQAAVLLDLFGLMGAYASGSCRDVFTSIYVFALAGVVFVGVVIHVMVDALNRSRQETSSSVGENDTDAANVVAEQKSGMDIVKKAKQTGREKEKKRKLLLLLAILAVSITYQAGLTPPGKFWLEHGDAAHHVGDPVLADNYPRRYRAFFYCNATSFMVSVAVIVVLVGRKLSDAADRKYWWPIYAAMGAGLIGLMGAYAAGTTRRVKTSVYVFALVGAVFLFAVLHIGSLHQKLGDWISGSIQRCIPKSASTTGHTTGDEDGKKDDRYRKHYKMSKYLLLLGILAASITYQAGLDPPGSVWPSDGDGHAAGDPVLHDGSRRRYHAFFYSNSTCFVTSIVVIVLLLQGTLLSSGRRWPMRAVHTAVVLDLLGLLVAYATGGSRDWGTSGYVLAMAATVLGYVGIYMALSYGNRKTASRTQDGTIPVQTVLAMGDLITR